MHFKLTPCLPRDLCRRILRVTHKAMQINKFIFQIGHRSLVQIKIKIELCLWKPYVFTMISVHENSLHTILAYTLVGRNLDNSDTSIGCHWSMSSMSPRLKHYYSTLMVILPMPCWGCRVVSHGMAVPSDAFTHRVPFLFAFSLWNWENNGQFYACINLLPFTLIWSAAPCLKHWNQRWFGDGVFIHIHNTIGKTMAPQVTMSKVVAMDKKNSWCNDLT